MIYSEPFPERETERVTRERERESVCERERRAGAAKHGNHHHQHLHHLQLRRALSRLLSFPAPGLAFHAQSLDLRSQNNPQPACRRKQNKKSGIFRVIHFDHVARR